ncbi:MAG: hypothetical protein HQM16_16875 [Deltaproteobacteria bacterium]|nr:hypothetical protein [Deltaproteobacteria bacterium]
MITVTGNVSTVMWQHVGGFYASHPYDNFFDINKSQTVVYTSGSKINCKGKTIVEGKVVAVGGDWPQGSKMADSPGYKEYHILADKWQCVE